MPLQNGLGLTGFASGIPDGFEGDPADHHGIRAMAAMVPLFAQETTVTIAGFDTDGDAVTVNITLPDGTVVSETTTRVAGVPLDDAIAADALRDQINDREALNGHVEASSVASVLTLAFEHDGVIYPVTTEVVDAGGVATSATVAEVTAAGGPSITIGRFVANGGADENGQPIARPMDSADDEDDLLGIHVRRLTLPNRQDELASANDVVEAGDIASVGYRGALKMRNNGSVASAFNGQVFVVVDTAGGQELGQARADADGGNTTAVNTLRARWKSVTQPGKLGRIYLEM